MECRRVSRNPATPSRPHKSVAWPVQGFLSAFRNLSKDWETKNTSALSNWSMSMSENTLLNVSWDGTPWESGRNFLKNFSLYRQQAATELNVSAPPSTAKKASTMIS